MTTDADVAAFEAALAEANTPPTTLEAALSASLEAVGVPVDPQAAEDARRLEAAAQGAVAGLLAWSLDGSDFLGRVWDLVDRADDRALIHLLHQLVGAEGLLAALGDLVRRVEAALGARHGRGPLEDDDGVVIAAVDRTAKSTKWDVEKAWPDVAAAVRRADRGVIDPVAGELEDDTARALRIVRQLCGVSYLKVGELEGLGLDPDDYRTRSGWRWTVRLP